MVDSKSYFNRYFSELLNADNVFRWEVQIVDENRHEEYLHRANGFFNFVSKLLEICVKYEEKNFSQALQIINDLESKLADIFQDTPDLCISRALYHVVHISKAAILLCCGKSEDFFEVLGHEQMTSYRDLTPTEEAAVLALRSACCAMYSYKGLRDALDFIDRAIRKDAKTPFWRFLKAMYLYRSRTVLNPVDAPSLDELELLKKVNEEQSNPLFMVYLADVLRESADANKNRKELNFWFIPQELQKSLRDETENSYKESKMLYEKAYELRPKCPVIASRCANGLMKIQQAYQNIKLAKEIIVDLLQEDNNNAYLHTVAAFYFLRFGNKPDSAKNHLEHAMKLNVFNAHVNSIRSSFKNKKDGEQFDISKLEKLLDTFVEAPKRKMIFAQIISYYLFIDVNLETACNNMIKYLDAGGPRNSIQNHKSIFIDTREPISLVDIIADDVRFNMVNRNLNPKLREFLEKFIHKMHFYNLNCAWSGKPQNLRRQILEGRVPDNKSRCLQKPNQNRKFGKNVTPNQKYGGNKAPNQKQNFMKVNPKNSPKPNTARPPNRHLDPRPSNRLPDPIRTKGQEKTFVPESMSLIQEVEKADHHNQVNRPERAERKDRHRIRSVSSNSSDDRRSRSRKHHRRKTKKYATSSSESESYSRRHRSPSRRRSRHHRSKEHKKSRDDRRRHRHHRYSSVSSNSSTSYDRYRRKGRKNKSRRSYSSSDASPSERYEKKYSSRYAGDTSLKKADDDPRHLAKRMSELKVDHSEEQSYSRKKQ